LLCVVLEEVWRGGALKRHLLCDEDGGGYGAGEAAGAVQ
jgi:hypothetical protein